MHQSLERQIPLCGQRPHHILGPIDGYLQKFFPLLNLFEYESRDIIIRRHNDFIYS